MWQERADNFKREWQTAENTAQLLNNLAVEKMRGEFDIQQANITSTGQAASGIGEAIITGLLS